MTSDVIRVAGLRCFVSHEITGDNDVYANVELSGTSAGIVWKRTDGHWWHIFGSHLYATRHDAALALCQHVIEHERASAAALLAKEQRRERDQEWKRILKRAERIVEKEDRDNE